ncbi:integrase core domain-containing protein [Roseicella aquatilis]|nr:integrase core domain-containing protein [Roseicella aquatilis]
MSRKGEPFDNAPMESFFQTLEAEHADDTNGATHAGSEHAPNRRDVFAFMEARYNRQHLHSALGYLTPEQMELSAA